MAKTLVKFVMFLIPAILVICSMRAIVGHPFAMPASEEWVSMFASIGTNDGLMKAVADFNNSKLVVESNQVTDLVSFFSSFGSFFNMVGNAVMVFYQIIAVPFRILGWLFGLI